MEVEEPYPDLAAVSEYLASAGAKVKSALTTGRARASKRLLTPQGALVVTVALVWSAGLLMYCAGGREGGPTSLAVGIRYGVWNPFGIKNWARGRIHILFL